MQKMNTTLSCWWNCQIQKLALKPTGPLYHSGNFITDFRQMTELFNSFFAEQYSIVQNSSKLPTKLAPRTDQSLTSITLSQDDILKMKPK